MSRRLATGAKLRGLARRYASLSAWSERFASLDLESELEFALARGERYWNWKIPVHASMVQPPARLRSRREAAQRMIDAAAGLVVARDVAVAAGGPAGEALGERGFSRVTCLVMTPDMFGSEVCLFLERGYHEGHTVSGDREDRSLLLGPERSLAAEWGLVLPDGFGERGIRLEWAGDEPGEIVVTEQWWFGEV